MVCNRILATDLATDYEITTLCFNKNKTTYRYSRAYPIKIRRRLSQCPIKYDRTLQLKVGCSEAELNKAVAREAKSYELKVKGLTVSDPNAYSQSEKEILASDILRRAEATDGEFSLYVVYIIFDNPKRFSA